MKLYLCEKPSQARDIAQELGNPKKLGSHFVTDSGNVTWAYGHLLELEEPETYDKKYEVWSFDHLPILPQKFLLTPKQSGQQQLSAIKQLLKEAEEVIIATDSDREGEMIAREILDHCRYKGRMQRLWLSALDPESIRKGLKNLKPGTETEPLYHAALARSEADWLVGMNLTRALTVRCRKPDVKGALTVGRVQTPTLALVVRRDREIAHFRPKDYFEIVAKTEAESKSFALKFAPRDDSDRILDRSVAQQIADSARGTVGPLHVEKTPKSTSPPRLFSLSSFQKESNRRFGWGADRALAIAQVLYEKYKVTTYPRTDCDYLPNEQEADIPAVLGHLAGLAGDIGKAATTLKEGTPVIRATVFNTAKITAHHAIVPTQLKASLEGMNPDEKAGYLLIAARYLENLLPDYEYLQTRISFPAADKIFEASGTTPTRPGWKIVSQEAADPEEEKEENPTLPDLPDGVTGKILETTVLGKKTKAPKPYTEGTLLDDMKHIAKFVTDPEKKSKLKETAGIGTEATRANIIAKLCSRNDKGEVYPQASPFLELKKGKGKAAHIVSTPKGQEFITLLEAHLPQLADAGETALWEDGLDAIAARTSSVEKFVHDIGNQIRIYLDALQKAVPAPVRPKGPAATTTDQLCPKSQKPILDGGDYWTFPGYPGFYARKIFMKRIMTVDDYLKILTAKEPVVFDNLEGVSGKKFKAEVFYADKTKFNGKPGLELKFV